jgi:hypothetical protein
MKKKIYVKTYFVISLCLFLQIANAQFIVKKADQTRDFRWSLGPVAGIKFIKSLVIYDFGLQASRTVSIGQRIRFEASYRTSGDNLKQNWGRIPMNMKTDIGTLILGAGYDWFPFVSSGNHREFLESLKAIGGVWYINKPKYYFDASLQDPLVWGSITFSPEEIGSVATTIETNKVQPFLGLGYDEFYLGKNINFSVNGGIFYQGKPKVTMLATNMLKPTEESAARFEHNLESYQFSPFVQIVIQYNL